MPLYLRRADAVISVSNYSTQGFVSAMPWCAPKIRTIYFSAKDIFRTISDPQAHAEARRKYALPERFVLTVIHYDSGRKNFGNMLKAFQIAKHRGLPHKFIVVGRDCEKYAQDHPLDSLGLAGEVRFFGWIDQADLPMFYNLADLYLYPTRVEAFPIPLCEAMACGCPIVTSNDTGLREIAGDAALLVDPENPIEIADAICQVLGDDSLRAELKRKGIARSKTFSWRNCARETLALFESLQGDRPESSKKPLLKVAH
jgi:glycosyltransferase involved in cell wall biosynthesis